MASSETVNLSDLELDALTELANIAVGRAALSLREMVGEQVLLSVPAVALIARTQAVETLGGSTTSDLVAIHEVFEGDISGRALLIFPETKSLELVKTVIGTELSIEDIVELEQEALAEIGNIILNSWMSSIANMLQRNLKMSLPEVIRGNAFELLNLAPPPDASDLVLFLYINFTVRGRAISGYIVMLMDLPSITALKWLLDELIARAAGEAADQSDVRS